MPTLEILIGLSGSGKSTYAQSTGKAIVSRDALRVAMFGSDHQDYYEHSDVRAREDAVTVAEHAAIEGALTAGLDVIHDATNLTPKFAQNVANIGYRNGAEVSVKVFDVPLTVALYRNNLRAEAGGRRVPDDVIRRQFDRFQRAKKWEPKRPFEPSPYVSNRWLPDCFLVDIDGTLAHMDGRGPFDWKRVGEDTVDRAVASVVGSIYNHREAFVILMSGRDSVCRPETEKWLEDNNIPYDELFMRAANDNRPDDVIKHELFDKFIRTKYNVIGVFDDRKKVVDMWKKMGIKVFNVSGLDNGDF